jgi:hypothetical protein
MALGGRRDWSFEKPGVERKELRSRQPVFLEILSWGYIQVAANRMIRCYQNMLLPCLLVELEFELRASHLLGTFEPHLHPFLLWLFWR